MPEARPTLEDGTGSPQGLFTASTKQQHSIGTIGRLNERTFVYASNGGSAISKGNLCSVEAPGAVGVRTSVAYSSGGAANTNTVTVTLGAGAVTADQFADGWIYVIDGTGSGQLRKIKSHPAAASAATLEITTWDDWEDAIASGAELSIVSSEYANVVVHPGMAATTLNLIPVGVTPLDVPSGASDTQYFWLQTGGPALCVGDGTTFVPGIPVVPANATADAGQVTIFVDAVTGTPTPDPIVGYVITANDQASDGDYRFIHLTLHS